MVLNFCTTKDIKPGQEQTTTKISPSLSFLVNISFSKTPEASIKSTETKKSLTSFQKAHVTGQSRKK